MEHLTKALLAGTSVLAMTSHAHSAVAIGNLIISAALSLGAGSLLPVASAAAIGATAISAGLAVANLAMNFLNRPKANPQDIKNTSQGAEGPGHYAFGRVELGGQVAFGNTVGYKIYRLLLHCFGEIDAVEEYIYDGRDLVVDPNGDVTSPPWVRAGGGSRLNLQTKLGNGTETAWPELIADFPSLWTSDHRVRGIGHTLMRALNPGTGEERFAELFQGGIKELTLVARVTKCFDPRDGQTRWTDNAALVILHFFRMLPTSLDDMINFDLWADAADASDDNLPTATGTRKRARLCGGWKGPLTTDIIEDMLESAGMELVNDADGKWYPRFLEDEPEPEVTLLSRHIIDIDYKAGPDGAKRPNVAKGKFFSAERQYEVAELNLSDAAWAKDANEVSKHGEQENSYDLVFCPDSAQAQPIIRRLFHMDRADFGTLITNFAGLACWGKRTALIEIPDVGEDGASITKRVRLGTVRPNDADGTCEIPFQVVPDELSTPWNPATDEVPAPPVLARLQNESELDTPAAPAEYAQVIYPNGFREFRIRFSGVTGGSTAEANYRRNVGGSFDPWASMTEVLTSGVWYAHAAANLEGDGAEARVRFFSEDDGGSYFSPSLSVSPVSINNATPAAPVNAGAGAYETTQLRVSSLRVESRTRVSAAPFGPWSDVGIYPVSPWAPAAIPELGGGPDTTTEVRIYCRTSNGTEGPPASYSLVVPPIDP